jgi:hypothetical protein
MIHNATYLFTKPKRDFRHSQSRWNTIAQMALIYLARTKKDTLNVYHSVILQEPEKWLAKSDRQLDIKDWSVDNMIVEGDIKYMFDDQSIMETQLYPDIVYKNESKKEIGLIVVRTIGKTVRGRTKDGCDNIDRAIALTERIRAKGWKCNLYYLMSYGHEDEGSQCAEDGVDEAKRHKDWKRLESVNAHIILWEELLSLIDESEIVPYIDANLQQYTLMPEWV